MLHKRVSLGIASSIFLAATAATAAFDVGVGDIIGGSSGGGLDSIIGDVSGDFLDGVLGGGGGDTLYDFESVFSEGSGGGGGGGIGDIFSDLFGSIDAIGFLESLIGGDGGLTSPCGVIIMNMSDYMPASGGSGAGNSIYDCDTGENVLFEGVMEQVGSELGIPSEITDLITGKGSMGDFLGETIDQILGDALGTELEGQIGRHDSDFPIIGAQGIPDPEELEKAMDEYISVAVESGNPEDQLMSVFAPNVNTTLPVPVVANGVLTDAITDRGLSVEGQEVTQARLVGAQAAKRTAGIIADRASDSSEKQLMSAFRMNKTIRKQTSTQDTLKEALTGKMFQDTQATQILAGVSNQIGLTAELQAANLQSTIEMRDGVFANGKSLKLLNEQAISEAQRSMSESEAMRSQALVPVRTFGAYK